MIDIYTYIQEGIKTVKMLLRKGDLFNANLGCQELLKVDPYNKKLQKLLTKIEKKILKQNLKIVKQEIKRTWSLWDEKRHGELLQIYERLLEYAPQYGELHELMEKAEKAMNNTEREQRKAFIREALEAVEKIFREGKWEDVIQACKEILVVHAFNEKAKNLLAKARENFVEQKLKENETLVDSAEFERQIEFFGELLHIDPNSEKVKNLLLEARKKLQEKKKIETQILVNEGEKRIKTLFDQQEYEKVLQACEELRFLDTRNLVAMLYDRKARAVIIEEIDQKVFSIIQEAFAKLREEYGKNKRAFVKI